MCLSMLDGEISLAPPFIGNKRNYRKLELSQTQYRARFEWEICDDHISGNFSFRRWKEIWQREIQLLKLWRCVRAQPFLLDNRRRFTYLCVHLHFTTTWFQLYVVKANNREHFSTFTLSHSKQNTRNTKDFRLVKNVFCSILNVVIYVSLRWCESFVKLHVVLHSLNTLRLKRNSIQATSMKIAPLKAWTFICLWFPLSLSSHKSFFCEIPFMLF